MPPDWFSSALVVQPLPRAAHFEHALRGALGLLNCVSPPSSLRHYWRRWHLSGNCASGIWHRLRLLVSPFLQRAFLWCFVKGNAPGAVPMVFPDTIISLLLRSTSWCTAAAYRRTNPIRCTWDAASDLAALVRRQNYCVSVHSHSFYHAPQILHYKGIYCFLV